MLRKKLVAVLTAMALVLTLVPAAAFAEGGTAEDQTPAEEEKSDELDVVPIEVKIFNFDNTDDNLRIEFEGKDGYDLKEDKDVINIYIDNKDAFGNQKYTEKNDRGILELKKEGAAYPDGLAKGSEIEVTVNREGYKEAVFTDTYDGEDDEDDEDEDDDAYRGPDYFDFITESVDAGVDDEKITIAFNKSYAPKKYDEVRLLAYDRDGKRIREGDSTRANLKEDSYRDGNQKRIDFYVDIPDEAEFYKIEYYDSSNAKYHYFDTLAVKGSFSAYEKLILDYKDNEVEIGQEVTPKVYLEAEDGSRKELKKDVTFVFAGDQEAIESSDARYGKFRVKDDVKYVGKQIIVTASAGKHSATEKVNVVEKGDKSSSSTVKPGEKRAVIMIINSMDLFINNKKEHTDAIPVIKNDRTFVPYRALAESFGAHVDYNDATRSVTVTYGNKIIVMTVGQKGYTVNGEPKTMDVAPYIANDRTMVPVRFVAEAMGFDVEATFNLDGTTANVIFKNY